MVRIYVIIDNRSKDGRLVESILRDELSFPKTLGFEAIELIQSMLQKKPSSRPNLKEVREWLIVDTWSSMARQDV